MDSEKGRDDDLEEKPSASDSKRVIFSPGVKVLDSDKGGGCEQRSEITLKVVEHGSARSLDSSDSVSLSSSKASCGDTGRDNPQIPPNSVRERKEGRESTSQPLAVDNACLVKDMSPILSPPVQVMEFPEDYDPDSPGYVFNGDSPTMEANASSDDLLFSINMENESFSGYSAAGECEYLHKSGTKANESKRSDELGRFDRISPTTKGVEPEKKSGVKRGEKETVGEPISNVREGLMDNQVDTSRGDFGEHNSDGTVALPKKKKSSWKSCHCFTWPSCCSKSRCCSCKWIRWPKRSCKCIHWPICSCKWIRWPSCSFKWLSCRGCLCEKTNNQLKYPRWAGGCFKCLYWPCLKCRC